MLKPFRVQTICISRYILYYPSIFPLAHSNDQGKCRKLKRAISHNRSYWRVTVYYYVHHLHLCAPDHSKESVQVLLGCTSAVHPAVRPQSVARTGSSHGSTKVCISAFFCFSDSAKCSIMLLLCIWRYE